MFWNRPKPTPSTADPAAYWSLDQPLLWVSDKDPWRIRDACEGVQVFGAPGSGKTSGPGAALAKAFLSYGFGGVMLTAKPGERQLWEKYAAETSRSDTLRIFSPDEPWRFNFMDYEYQQGGADGALTENLVALFSTVMEIAARRSAASEQAYWKNTLNQLLRNAIDLVAMARGRVALPDLYEVIASAPKDAEEVESEKWQASSTCHQFFVEAERKVGDGPRVLDLKTTARFWLKEYPDLHEKTRSIIVSSFTAMADGFLRGTMRELFSTSTNLTPDDTQRGLVIVLDLPVKKYHEVGQLAQVLFKYMWQRATERRDLANPRPVFLWADESQFFITARDNEFLSTSREARAVTVYLTQNLPNYYAALGGERSKHDVDALLGCLQTKFFCCNSDHLTNTWAADLFSKAVQYRDNFGTNTGGAGGHSGSFGGSATVDYEVLQREFTMLKKGGPEHAHMVEAFIHQAGRAWKASGRPYHRVLFKQS